MWGGGKEEKAREGDGILPVAARGALHLGDKILKKARSRKISFTLQSVFGNESGPKRSDGIPLREGCRLVSRSYERRFSWRRDSLGNSPNNHFLL